MLIIISLAVHNGVGIISTDAVALAVRSADVTKLVVANNNVWAICVNVTKVSILMQYLRIFSGRPTRILCYILLFLLLPAGLWGILGGTLLCSPVAKLWYPSMPGHCASAQSYWISVATIDIILDFVVLILPVPSIASLNLPRKQKCSLVLVFLLGFFVCAVSLVRLGTVLAASSEGEYIKSGIRAISWSVVEANVGIICACLIALRPLVARILPRCVEGSHEVPKHRMILPRVENAEATTTTSSGKAKHQRGDTGSVHSTTLVGPETPSPTADKRSSFARRTSLPLPYCALHSREERMAIAEQARRREEPPSPLEPPEIRITFYDDDGRVTRGDDDKKVKYVVPFGIYE